MSIILKYNKIEYNVDTILWDRDSCFIDFNNYWGRFVGSLAQNIAENTTTNWNKFNLVRTQTIKSLGINIDTGIPDLSSPVNIIPLNDFPFLLTSSLKNTLPEKSSDELCDLFKRLINKSLKESQPYIKESIIKRSLDTVIQINKKIRQILITNDSEENNTSFLEESNLGNLFSLELVQVNKEQLTEFLKNDSIFMTKNAFVQKSYLSKGTNNALLIEDLSLVTFSEVNFPKIIIHIDGASKGNPGPSSIGIAFYTDGEPIFEVSEFIGNHTNNFAEYTALIKALEISLEKGYKNIEIRSDSELVVKQINKIYKVKDADIKELFDKANLLIEKIISFKISHVPREENLRADKLANNALKNEARSMKHET